MLEGLLDYWKGRRTKGDFTVAHHISRPLYQLPTYRT